MTERPRLSHPNPPHEYQSYLLRLWRSGTGESGVWRVSLENARTGQWRSFPSLRAACTYLDLQMEQSDMYQEGDSAQPHPSMTEKPDE